MNIDSHYHHANRRFEFNAVAVRPEVFALNHTRRKHRDPGAKSRVLLKTAGLSALTLASIPLFSSC